MCIILSVSLRVQPGKEEPLLGCKMENLIQGIGDTSDDGVMEGLRSPTRGTEATQR